MTRLLVVAALTGAFLGGAAGSALAAPPTPDPTDCHQVNALLHIDNVRSCDGPPVS